jgi:hypothetical protein
MPDAGRSDRTLKHYKHDNYYEEASMHFLRHPSRKRRIANAVCLALGSALLCTNVPAAVYQFSFGPGSTPMDLNNSRANDALFMIVSPSGPELENTSYPYYGDPTWGYGFRTQITGQLIFDDATHSGTMTIMPFDFFSGGPMALHDITISNAGNDPITGDPLVIMNMLADWGGNNSIQVSQVWNIKGLMDAINAGLHSGQVVTGGATGVTEYFRKGIYPVGPAPIASTSWDTTRLCTGCYPFSGLPLVADGIAGSPMDNGPFLGFSAPIDIRSLVVGDFNAGITVRIANNGSNIRECSSPDGASVALSSTVTTVPSDPLSSVTWTLDGTEVASGQNVEITVPLGTHAIAATATADSGDSATVSVSITVRDTTDPQITARFVDRNGYPVPGIGNGDKAFIEIAASDLCDTDPEVKATYGQPAYDGDVIKAGTGKNGNTRLVIKGATEEMSLTVSAADHSGNMASKTTTITITND